MEVPSALLQECSNLPPGNIVVENSLHLTHIPEEVGHVLVHHLFTGTFQCLAPRGSQQERQINELMTCIRVYAVAWDYELSSLKEQSQREIQRLGICLPLASFLAALDEIYPHPSKDDIWLGGYLKDRMKARFAGRETARDTASDHVGPKLSIAKLVFDNALRLHEEGLEVVIANGNHAAMVCQSVITLTNCALENEPVSCEDVPQPVYKYGFVRQKVLPEPQTAEALGQDDITLETTPVYGNAVPGSPGCESVLGLSHSDEHTHRECITDLEPARRSAPSDPVSFQITYEEVSIASSALEPPGQNQTPVISGFETDSSAPVFTPPSSTISSISTDSVKLDGLENEARHKQGALRATKKASTLQAKMTKRRKLQEAQAVQDVEELDVICDSMSQHLKIGGEWKDCEYCRNLVDGLAAGL